MYRAPSSTERYARGVAGSVVIAIAIVFVIGAGAGAIGYLVGYLLAKL